MAHLVGHSLLKVKRMNLPAAEWYGQYYVPEMMVWSFVSDKALVMLPDALTTLDVQAQGELESKGFVYRYVEMRRVTGLETTEDGEPIKAGWEYHFMGEKA